MRADVDYRAGAKNSLKKVMLAGFDDTSIALFQAGQSDRACVNPYHAQRIRRLSAKPGEVLAATDRDLLTPWLSVVEFVAVARWTRCSRRLSKRS